MNVAEAVARGLAAHGVDHVFGVVGSGNFHVTNALIAGGARFVAAAHEGGAASMADAYARVSGRLVAISVHQGPGVTNALTGIVEAAKSRTPLIVLAPEATHPRSNFFLDLPALAASIGAGFHRVTRDGVVAEVAAACRAARDGAGQTVMLALPLDVQAMAVSDEVAAAWAARVAGTPPAGVATAPAVDVTALVDALAAARRPVFIAGRGASRRGGEARDALIALAERCGALVAVSAAAKGLFAGDPWYLDISGGFATPLTAELIGQADLVVAWGSTLNMWTTRHGRLIAPGTRVAQVDVQAAALGVNRAVDVAVCGELVDVARRCGEALARGGGTAAAAGGATPAGDGRMESSGWRTPALAARIAAEGRWRAVPFTDDSGDGRIDPRALTIALDDLVPAARTVVIDSGNFMGYPSMFLDVPDAAGFCFTQAFQSIGLGLASAIGAAVARPDRLTVAALGDGGFLMAAVELATAARLGIPLLVVVYNDAAYGAEVHHFGPHGHPLDTVTFADTDLAAIARGFGCAGVTVRAPADLAEVGRWLAGPRDRPLVIDAKVVASRASWWLEEAFRGH
jgi:thiamine pyrophosphate-dependent acetolactate synthase large subunit-like protein